MYFFIRARGSCGEAGIRIRSARISTALSALRLLSLALTRARVHLPPSAQSAGDDERTRGERSERESRFDTTRRKTAKSHDVRERLRKRRRGSHEKLRGASAHEGNAKARPGVSRRAMKFRYNRLAVIAHGGRAESER